ncbi:unnamed protein product [Adineta ricciae]|uniref:Uncharacterized protein n=1 Tax=Adineta ricciae TaxID=249248 RepID=A0A814YT43_ADIRI|nr:unnamed protein product [Adineta ricciae]
MKQKTFDVIKEFSSKYLITAEALTNDVFNTQAKELIDHFISVTVAKNMYINEFIEFSISKNSIHTDLRSNYLMKIFPSVISFGPVTYQTTDDMCRCSADNVCSSPAGIYNITERTKIMNGNIFHINQSDTPLIFQLSNIKVGSYPYSSLYSSILECFYNQSCIDLLRSYIPGFSFVSPLISSDFPSETFVKSLIIVIIKFVLHIPVFYSYNRRFNFLYILTVVLGLFGGLKMILQISIPYFIQLIRRIKMMIYQRWKRKKTTIVIQSNEDQRMGFFYILKSLCALAKKTLSYKLAVFNRTYLITKQVLSNNIFQIQISSIIQQFQQQTISSFLVLFELIRTSVQLGNGNNNVKIEFDDDEPVYITLTNYYEKNCSCGINTNCTTFVAFFCHDQYCDENSTIKQVPIPAFVLSCFTLDSFLMSTLKCMYDSSCFQMLLDDYSFGLVNSSIDPRAINVTLLNSTIKKCAPEECLYTYEERFVKSYVISTTVSTVSGLSIALRLLVPLLVKFLRRIYYRYWKSQGQDQRILVGIREKIQTMNVYRKKTMENLPANEETILTRRQHIATGFYIVFFIISIVIILFSVGFSSKSYHKTVSYPNISTYEKLQSQYFSTMTCPCSQIAIPYSKFLSVRPSAYHEICSSDLISFDFIEFLWGEETTDGYTLNVDRKILTAHIRLLSAFCSLGKNLVEQKIKIFSEQNFISIETLTRHSFQIQINSLIQNFIDEIPISFRWTHQYITDLFHGNQLSHRFGLNWLYFTSNERNHYYIRTNPTLYNESGQPCSCLTSSTCSRSLLASFDTVVQLPGIVLGCLPIIGLRLSTLECFYNSTCLSEFENFINSSEKFNILNISVETRFSPISSVSIGTLIDELFIEKWENSSNYSNYFVNCAPLTCRYSYEKRNDFLYVLTTFLALYDGLSFTLKVFIWYILSIYWKIRQRFVIRRNQIQVISGDQQ